MNTLNLHDSITENYPQQKFFLQSLIEALLSTKCATVVFVLLDNNLLFYEAKNPTMLKRKTLFSEDKSFLFSQCMHAYMQKTEQIFHQVLRRYRMHLILCFSFCKAPRKSTSRNVSRFRAIFEKYSDFAIHTQLCMMLAQLSFTLYLISQSKQ